ncbi:MAG TPA: RNA methyltransferase [Thermomicrobiales bacterium]|nr:RNA methyltransferase [Thermomicrobiales bacterium]
MTRAIDRESPESLPEHGRKTSKWPRTTRRQERIQHVLARRQTSLTVVLEDVHDPHNASAVLRSCDGVGILDVHLVYMQHEPPKRSFARTTSGSAAKWIRTHYHDSIQACYRLLREQEMCICATALGRESDDLYALDLTQPTALVFGNEMRGVSEEAIAGADKMVFIPMQGMVESLNISVACAVTLYEAMRQRIAAGAYESPELSAEQLASLEQEWLRK